MIHVTIEIKELNNGPVKDLNVALRVNRDKETPIEQSLERRLLPALNDLLRNSGILTELEI